MARTVMNIPFTGDFNEIKGKLEQTVSGEGFKQKDYHGEQVWKKGVGLLTAMKFIKFEYSENGVNVFAWVQAGIGSIGGKEMNLEGFVASLPKQQLKGTLQRVYDAAKANLPSAAGNNAVNALQNSIDLK